MSAFALTALRFLVMAAPGLPSLSGASENPVLGVKTASSESNSASDPSRSDAGRWQTPESDDTAESTADRREQTSTDSRSGSCKEIKSKSESDSSASSETLSAENRALRNQLRQAQAQVQVCAFCGAASVRHAEISDVYRNLKIRLHYCLHHSKCCSKRLAQVQTLRQFASSSHTPYPVE